MAKSKKLETDDFDFDSALDLPDFDFDAKPPKDDRSPVTKFAHGAVGGFKDEITNPAFIRKTLQASLPKGYGQVMDLADQGASTLRNLYNTAGKELKPAINDIKRTTKKIMPAVEGVLPKSVSEKIKGWANEEKKGYNEDRDAMREAGLQADLTDIFSTQTELNQNWRSEDKAQDALRDQMDQKKHNEQMGQFDAMRKSLQMGVSFDTKITAKYQRKSLEIQYRQYFLQMDLLEETKKNNAESLQKLEGILKNTGLPDFAKLKTSERLHEVLRNKFIGGLGDTVFEKRREFLRNVGKRLASGVVDKARGITDGIQRGVGMADSLADLHELQQSMGGLGVDFGPATIGGSIAGGMAADHFGEYLGKKGRQYAMKNEKLVRKGNDLSAWATNLAANAHEWAKSDKHENSSLGFLNSLVRFGKDSVLGAMGGQDTSLQEDKFGDGNNPDVFGRRTNKSITEIIPGYLARMWRELRMMRTGQDAPLVEYDFVKNTFNDRATIGANVREHLFGKNEVSSTKDQVNRLVDELVKGSKVELTKEQRTALGRMLLRDNLQNKTGSADRYADEGNYNGQNFQNREAFSSVFKNYFKDDHLHDKRRVFANEFGNLGQYMADSRAKIQDHLNYGNREHLEELGLVGKGENFIDMNRLYDYYYGDDSHNQARPQLGSANRTGAIAPAPTQQTTGKKKSGRQRRREREMAARMAQPDYESYGELPTSHAQMDLPHEQPQHKLEIDPRGFDTVVAAIKEFSAQSQVDKVNETLLRIEKQVTDGINVNHRMQDGHGNWTNMQIKDIPGKLGELGHKGFNWARGRLRQGWDTTGTALKKGWAGAVDMKDKLFNKLGELNDVYVQGEIIPRLTKAGIEARKYRDKVTGKVIEKLEDIVGDVVDEDGNIVLTFEDAKKAFVKTKWGTKALQKIAQFSKWSKGQLIGGTAVLRGLGGTVWEHAVNLAKKAWDLTDQAQDVYVKGETVPRLLGVTMKAGGYASRVSSKTIYKPSQIDGPVFDQNGQIVLTDEDIKNGLLDARGNPLTTGMKKLVQLGLGAMEWAKEKAIWAKDKLMESGKNLKNWASNKFGFGEWGAKLNKWFQSGPAGILSVKALDVLKDIRKILDDRLPGKKSHVEGDVDGDGIREGSYADLQMKKKSLKEQAKEKYEKLKGEGFAKSKSLGEFLTDKAKSLYGFFKKRKHRHDDDEDDDDGLSLDDLPDMDRGGKDLRDAKRARRLKRLRGGKGFWGKARGLGRGALSLGGRALDFVPGSGLIRGAGRGIAGMGRGALAAGRGVLGMGSGVGGALLGGAGKLLGGLGTAYGAYSTYNDIKEGNYGQAAIDGGLTVGGAALTAGGFGALGTGLMAAGGTALAGIGAVLSSPVILGALAVGALGAGAYYGYKYLTRKTLGTLSAIRYAQYGFLQTNTDHLQDVFGLEDDLDKGIQFTNGTPSIDEKKVDIKKALNRFGVDEKDDNQRSAWIAWFMKRFKPTYLAHKAALAGLKNKTELSGVDDLKGEDKKQYLSAIKNIPGADFSYLGNPFPGGEKLVATDKEINAYIQVASEEIAKESKGDGKGALKEAAGAATATAAAAATGGAATLSSSGGNAGAAQAAADIKLDASGAAKSGTGVVSLSSQEILGDVTYSGRVDALTALRMRTYGLVDLESDKVRTLLKMENIVANDIVFKNDVANWKGSLEQMLNGYSSYFGVAPGNNKNSIDWMTWFSRRFIPTFLKYMTVLKKVSGKEDKKVAEQSLKSQQRLDVAMVIYTTNTNYSEGTNSVWAVKESPWPGYAMNGDVKSIDGNLQTLKDQAQADKMSEEKGKAGKSGLTGGPDDNPTPAGATGTTPGFFERIFSNKDADGNKNKGGWFKNAGTVIGEKVGDILGFGGGREVEHPGKGTGGDINAIPKPAGKGYAAMKEMLAAVGKMTGVDDKLLASIIGIESGFDPNVKAASSTATGLGQIIKSTWNTLLSKYGSKYGIAPDTPPTDARANALLTAEYLKENAEAIKGSVNRKLTDTDLYFAHFLGAGGAKKFLGTDPTADAVQLMPDAARANPSIFYTKDGKSRTVGDVYALINSRVRSKAKQFGIDDGSEKLQAVATTKPATDGAAPLDKSTPEANGKTTNPIGNFKTVEQIPGVPLSNATNTPVAQPAPTSNASDSSSSSDGVSPAAREMSRGFQTPRSASVIEQAQNQAQDYTKVFGTLDEGIKRQIELQEGMLKGINRLVELGEQAGPKVAEEAPKPEVPAKQISAIKRPQQMQTPPVSMAKNDKW